MPHADTEKHCLWHAYAPQWQQNLDFAEMRQSVMDSGLYLDQFGSDEKKEDATQYALRRQMAMLLDLAPDLIEMRLTELFRVPPKRSFEESTFKTQIEAFIVNVDDGGTSLDAFMRRMTKIMLVTGVDVLVDKTSSEFEPLTAADETGLPFLSAFGPLERHDWATDHAGKYLWVKYALGKTFRDVGTCADDLEERFVTYTRTQVITEFVDAEGNVSTETLSHTMGIVPVVQIYWGRSIHQDQKAIAISLMDELAPLARYMLNLVSQGQIDLYLTVAFFVAIGMGSDEISGAIGAGVIKVIPNPEGDFKSIITSVDHITEKGAWIDRIMLAMMRKGKILGLNATLEGRANSGIQVAIESSPLHSELSSVANLLGVADQEIVRLAISREQGRPVTLKELGYTAVYNKTFTLQSTKSVIDDLKMLMDVKGVEEVPETVKFQMLKVLDVLARPGSKEHEKARKEIENFTGGSILPALINLTGEDNDTDGSA